MRFDVRGLEAALAKLGIPGGERYDLPDSRVRFPDGCHYRIEIAGVESVATMEAMLDEMTRRKAPVHRAIATVGGSTLLTMDELRGLASMARDAGVELIVNPCQSRGWDTGRQIVTREGLVSGMRIRGAEGLRYVLCDIFRCLEAGIRGFLVVDEGLLAALNQLRLAGDIPPETVFKVSVFAGHASPAGAKLLEQLGANTFNPLADVTVPMIASIRAAADIVMDVYVELVDAMGGFVRLWEAAEMARVGAPVYFKFEPGESEGAIYKSWADDAFHTRLVRTKVKHAEILIELVNRLNPNLKVSQQGPADLALPVV